MKRGVYGMSALLVAALAAGGCPSTDSSPTARPLGEDQVPAADAGNGGSRPSNPETIEAIRQALLGAYAESEPEEIPDAHFGFDAARDQNASPFDEGLVGTWTVYQLHRQHGTGSVTTLRIGADRSYSYGAYGGTFQYGRPKHYYQDSSTYWGFQEPIGGYYLRRGTPIYGQSVIRIYSSRDNRMVGFAVRE